jgi:hypothetical protein
MSTARQAVTGLATMATAAAAQSKICDNLGRDAAAAAWLKRAEKLDFAAGFIAVASGDPSLAGLWQG